MVFERSGFGVALLLLLMQTGCGTPLRSGANRVGASCGTGNEIATKEPEDDSTAGESNEGSKSLAFTGFYNRRLSENYFLRFHGEVGFSSVPSTSPSIKSSVIPQKYSYSFIFTGLRAQTASRFSFHLVLGPGYYWMREGDTLQSGETNANRRTSEGMTVVFGGGLEQQLNPKLSLALIARASYAPFDLWEDVDPDLDEVWRITQTLGLITEW
jgi:hypothetical protein